MRIVVAGLVLAAIGAEPAAAGTFHVYGLGMNGAGCPNGWQAQSLAVRPLPPGQHLLALGDPVGP